MVFQEVRTQDGGVLACVKPVENTEGDACQNVGLNFEDFDADTPNINVNTQTTKAELNTILSNSFGFGGTNACLVLRKFSE